MRITRPVPRWRANSTRKKRATWATREPQRYGGDGGAPNESASCIRAYVRLRAKSVPPAVEQPDSPAMISASQNPGKCSTLLIDNYDSFTYNLVQYLAELGEDVRVVRNDAIVGRRNPQAGAGAHRHFARTGHARSGRRVAAAARKTRRPHSDFRRLPRPSEHRAGVRRQSDPCAAASCMARRR